MAHVRERVLREHLAADGSSPFGPGYRVYFAEDGDEIVILLAAGDKASQARDIARAKERWLDYQEQ